MSREAVSATRCLTVWLAATASALGLVAWTGPALLTTPDPTFEGLLDRGCGVVAVGCTAWLWLVTSIVALDAVRGRHDTARAGIPAGVRRMVLGACGVALVGGAVVAPSYAAEHRPTPTDSVLAGLPVPDRATALSRMAAVFVRVQPHEHPRPDRHVVVHPGDTLWGLAERTLPPGSGDDAVADRWHRLYTLNRAVIGADPDLIVPGQRLLLPTGSEENL